MTAAALRRGACPSLAAPMRTGDGWLVRLAFAEGLTGRQLAALAAVAKRLGNGLLEVTARGSLQVRGLPERAPLAEALAPLRLPLADGLPVVTSPLAGRDPAEREDPRALAAALRLFAAPLPPKAAAVVDGGGAFPLDAISADVRLLRTGEGWRVGLGGTTAAAGWLDATDAETALARARDLLGRMSRGNCRGRALLAPLPCRAPAPPPSPEPDPVGRRFEVRGGHACAVGLAFGVADSDAVAALSAAAGDALLCPAPGRAIVVAGLAGATVDDFLAAAARLGFITEADDPRRAIAACAGAPACASGRIATRAIAARIAADFAADGAAGRPSANAGVRLHLSGCPKRCAQPVGPAVTLVADDGGPRVTGDGRPVPPALERYLLEAATW